MKRQVLNPKLSMLIFVALLSVSYSTHAVAHGDLEFTEGESAIREIAENTAPGTNIGEPLRYTIGLFDSCVRVFLNGPDAQAFDVVHVNRGAQLRTRFALDYENRDTYEVRVTAVGELFLYDRDTITVTISVTNVNEVPVFSEEIDEIVNLVYRLIPENTPVGIDIGPPVSAIDPDGSDVALTYSLSGINADMFEIDYGTGQLRTKMPLDYEAFESDPRTYFVEVEVSDDMASAKTEVWIDVLPVNEFAPMFIEGEAATREIHEEEEVGVNVGRPLTAMDMDAGETLEYSLSDTDGETFEVDSNTGQLRTKAKLDYESKPVYTVKVVASDGTRVGSIIVTIQVLTEFVEIPDFSLAWSIRRELGLKAGAIITKKNMLALTTLHEHIFNPLPVPLIRDLTGLEHATNLTRFECIGNAVADLTPIAGLTKLTSLWLTGNAISSLVPLEGLTNLESLTLASNEITDVTPLKNLTNLRILRLSNNSDLRDVSPLAGLVNLEILRLFGCSIEDTTPLADLTADIDIIVSGGSAPVMSDNRVGSLLDPAMLKTLDGEELQARLQRLYTESDGSLKYRQAIAILESVLASMRPTRQCCLRTIRTHSIQKHGSRIT